MEFLRFLKNHYEIILSVVSLIGTLIIFLLKKRPDANLFATVTAELLFHIPQLVCQAEEFAFDGSDKKKYVLKLCLEYLNRKFANLDVDTKEKILSRCDFMIEAVLSAPQKKEVL